MTWIDAGHQREQGLTGGARPNSATRVIGLEQWGHWNITSRCRRMGEDAVAAGLELHGEVSRPSKAWTRLRRILAAGESQP